ncbi:ubiquitin carboxyl-terminal hydrolase 2-like [Cimex lectularius]|uniref:Ubiquitin carboxyl-terminal hydrolase n=1 Tax=Cimex lectularius TaxID=79782 RepID=A0A8I6RT61_CIMLE|nr:ubiquitin carboxyl-terminal hydrolase 2-like [Cimex lectularius]
MMPCSSVTLDYRRDSSTMPVALSSRCNLDNDYGRLRYNYSTCSWRSPDSTLSKYSYSRGSGTASSRSSSLTDDNVEKDKSDSFSSRSTYRESSSRSRPSLSSVNGYDLPKYSSLTHQRKSNYTTFDLSEFRITYAPESYVAGSQRSSYSKFSSPLKTSDTLGRLKETSVLTSSQRKDRKYESSESLSAEDGSSTKGIPGVSRKEISSQSSETAGLSGLRNIGNTCFLNSVVQCLSHTRLLKDFLVSRDFSQDFRNADTKGSLIKAFADVIYELWSEGGKIVNTSSFKSQIQRYAPRFMGYNQQDAQEFLRYLLEGIHNDINRVTVKQKNLPEIDDNLTDSVKANESWKQYLQIDNSEIVDLFVGQLKSTLQCTSCDHKSTTFEVFWDLSLPLPTRSSTSLRLSQCLDHFTKEEILDGDEMPTCSKCKTRRKCTKRFSIQRFPKILVLHLKRFSPSERYRKLSATVEFPLTNLDMSAYSSNQQTCIYNLYAVSNHSGSAHSGHYTAYCLHRKNQQWYEFNDSRVSQTSSRNVVSSEAYLLFYEQVSPSASSSL